MKVIRWACFLMMILTTDAALSAGFDCKKALSDVEKMICKSADLSSLDGQLLDAYNGALKAVEASSKDALIEEQRNWIRYTRNICQDSVCLSEAYETRIKVLQQNSQVIYDESICNIPDGDGCRSSVIYRDASKRIDSFNNSLSQNKMSGKIIGCSMLLDVPVGTAHGNHSFGGLCTLQSGAVRSDVKICNDDMIGHFSVKNIDRKGESEKSLAEFTNAECFGG
ncbi:lysozyme inhibitor LprI family protein [Dyella silvatica]|uniref:lysozyme inhibitor LprI family protein n=1 Tax=Dyella silvatica TaxID=2992128 RepID=UPI002259C6BC|nr:lysozyme inhibitor LprI family protein [Dyella silvatica]